MRFVQTALLIGNVLVAFLVLIFTALIVDVQKDFWGEQSSYIVLSAEMVTIGALAVVLWAISRSYTREALVGGLVYGGALCFFLAWFLQPIHTFNRALDRVYDCEKSLYDVQSWGPDSGESVKHFSERLTRIRTELEARRLELRATDLRAIRSPRLFWDPFFSYNLLGAGIWLWVNAGALIAIWRRAQGGAEAEV